jgi:hypothetical protein
VFDRAQLESSNRAWLDSVPERVLMGKERSAGQIWHFLVPDQGIADYTDKAVREMLPAEMKNIRAWRNEFTKRFTPSDMRALERLATAVDHLWKKHSEDLRRVRRETAHIFPVFGQETNSEFAERGRRLTTRDRDELFERAILPRSGPASPYQRLKLAMDYWCALWFWPVEKADILPTRDEFMLELSALLEGTSREVAPLLARNKKTSSPKGNRSRSS